MLEAALEYAAKGLSVIPLRPAGKRPKERFSWGEFSRRRATESEIRSWWGEQPDANIGIVTGAVSGCVVVDIDMDRGGDAKKILAAMPTDLVSRTGSGYHLWYRHPGKAVKNGVGADGIDIRADGGYVVAPPSIHPSGRHYEWVRQGSPGRYRREASAPIADLADGVAEGSRNDSLARLVGHLAKQGVDPKIARNLLDAWNQANRPALPETELNTTIRSIYEAERRKRAGLGPSVEGFEAIGAGEMIARHGGAEVKWLAEGWVPEATIGLIASPPSAFKTWLTFDLLVATTLGEKFLDQTIAAKRKCLLIQQEDPLGGVADRLALIAHAKSGCRAPSLSSTEFDLPPALEGLQVHTHRGLKFSKPEVVAALGKKIKAEGIGLCVIDPLYSAADTDDYMARAASEMLPLKTIRDETGCSFLIVHHTKKSLGDAINRTDMWGSNFLNAFSETQWQIRREGNTNAVTVRRFFKVSKNPEDVTVTLDIDEAGYKYSATVGQASGAEMTPEETADVGKIAAALKEPRSLADLAKEVGVPRSTLVRKIAKLEKQKFVQRRVDGKLEWVGLPFF